MNALLNLSLFASTLWKAGWMTGLLPGVLLAALWMRYAKTLEKGKLIPFPKPKFWRRRADRRIRRVA